MTMTESELRQAYPELSQAELDAVLETKRTAEAIRRELGDLVSGHNRPRPTTGRRKRKPDAAQANYDGLPAPWARYCDIATRYEVKVPTQDRDDWRHDCILELEHAERRDGKPLPELRALRIARLMVALYYRQQERHQTRVCIYNGYPQDLHCKACRHRSDSPRCTWLAVRPLERLDGEIVTSEGYHVALIDTVASDRLEDMPEAWYDLRQQFAALPLRLVEIAYKRLAGERLDPAERKYLSRYRKQAQMALF